MDKYEEMNEAGDKLLKLNEEKQAQEIARAREESQWAWKHTLYHTEERARKAGHQEGYEEAREAAEKKMLDVAHKLLSKGMKTKDVADNLDLDIEIVSNIKL